MVVSQVESQWEDIDYRIKALNALRTNAQVLDGPIEKLESLLARTDALEEEKEELMDVVVAALTHFTKLCRSPLPPLPNTFFTRLDDNLANLRQMAKVSAAEEAADMCRLLQVLFWRIGACGKHRCCIACRSFRQYPYPNG